MGRAEAAVGEAGSPWLGVLCKVLASDEPGEADAAGEVDATGAAGEAADGGIVCCWAATVS